RALHELGRGRNQIILGIEFAARSETAADVDLDEIDRLFVEAKGCGERPAIVPGGFRGAPDRELARRLVPLGDEAARLHEHRGMTLDLEFVATDVVGLFEAGLGVALE